MITQFAAQSGLHISISPDTLFHIGTFPVTNSMLLGGFGVFVMLGILLYTANVLKNGKKKNGLVKLTQWAFEGMYKNCFEVIGNKKVAKSIAPVALAIFFTVLITYWVAILPGVGSITVGEAPLLRGLPADLNFTLALSVVAMVAVQYYAVKQHGFFGNAGRYLVNPLKNPIGAFEGLLELVGEFSRLVALCMRLFGNAFAGEVLLMVIVVLAGAVSVGALPVFLLFELFIGFIQAYVFYILTLIFTALAIAGHGDHDDANSETVHSVSDDSKVSDGVIK